MARRYVLSVYIAWMYCLNALTVKKINRKLRNAYADTGNAAALDNGGSRG
jgi:hypothetical protein